MSDKITLPPQVQEEISLYLAGDETIIEAIPSTTGSVGKLGELWVLLTDRHVLFYTCEHKKDPVVALIGRKDLQSISYEVHPAGVTLTFISLHRPQHPTRIAFLRAQRPLVNKFCEELSKDVPFVVIGMEDKTESAAKPARTDAKPASGGFEESAPASQVQPPTVTSLKPSEAPATAAPVPPPSASPVTSSPSPAASVTSGSPADKPLPERIIEVIPPPPSRPPEVRLETGMSARSATGGTLKAGLGTIPGAEMPLRTPVTPPPEPPKRKESERPPAPKSPMASVVPPVSPSSGVKTVKPPPAAGRASEASEPVADWAPEVRFVVFSTLIALVVGFIWYRLFEAIGDTRPRR